LKEGRGRERGREGERQMLEEYNELCVIAAWAAIDV
jgi:hypothetical protein